MPPSPDQTILFKFILWLENKALCVIIPMSWMVLEKQLGKAHALHNPDLDGWVSIMKNVLQRCHFNTGFSSPINIYSGQLFIPSIHSLESVFKTNSTPWTWSHVIVWTDTNTQAEPLQKMPLLSRGVWLACFLQILFRLCASMLVLTLANFNFPMQSFLTYSVDSSL